MPFAKRPYRDFILENAKLTTPTLVPEIRLYLAHESLPLWQEARRFLENEEIELPFWAFAWAGGQAVARHILDHPELVAGKTVVDLGTGSGLVAIAAALSGAREVSAVDIDPVALVACQLNSVANGVHVDSIGEDILDGGPRWGEDVVLIGDLFYEAETAVRVLGYAERCSELGSEVLVGDPRRSYFPEDRFSQMATYEVPSSQELEDADIKKAMVWKLI